MVDLVALTRASMVDLLPPDDDHAGDMGPVTPEELEGDA